MAELRKPLPFPPGQAQAGPIGIYYRKKDSRAPWAVLPETDLFCYPFCLLLSSR